MAESCELSCNTFAGAGLIIGVDAGASAAWVCRRSAKVHGNVVISLRSECGFDSRAVRHECGRAIRRLTVSEWHAVSRRKSVSQRNPVSDFAGHVYSRRRQRSQHRAQHSDNGSADYRPAEQRQFQHQFVNYNLDYEQRLARRVCPRSKERQARSGPIDDG